MKWLEKLKENLVKNKKPINRNVNRRRNNNESPRLQDLSFWRTRGVLKMEN